MKWIAESYETKKRVLVHMCRYSRFLLRVTISSDLFCAQREPEIWAIYEHHVTLSAEGRASQAEKKVSLTKNHETASKKERKAIQKCTNIGNGWACNTTIEGFSLLVVLCDVVTIIWEMGVVGDEQVCLMGKK